jgi:hypothetical protein
MIGKIVIYQRFRDLSDGMSKSKSKYWMEIPKSVPYVG